MAASTGNAVPTPSGQKAILGMCSCFSSPEGVNEDCPWAGNGGAWLASGVLNMLIGNMAHAGYYKAMMLNHLNGSKH